MTTAQGTWKERKRPTRLERRFEFSDYEETREFLESLADISEATGRYPDISFGRTHVSLTIQADEATGVIADDQRDFARRVDEIAAAEPAMA
ncbi:4a-hydroxytetrahydrobiopterin dehydratase [Thiorhodococcus minor]|uniref:4a-hydroxytetrahydrobiopterin dehydratase n=1 Tax=Thiorhodococcus minor TaxID=57489 RepID=A0A6M0K709_9GAMM|nr:4a-hydroxytetrahydrobiopterin dehydratase [Thiorhodococcus minor]NEV64703.1 pterin-4-alpha-carbinolamine dehydratase [Thiorhodococcus minor]